MILWSLHGLLGVVHRKSSNPQNQQNLWISWVDVFGIQVKEKKTSNLDSRVTNPKDPIFKSTRMIGMGSRTTILGIGGTLTPTTAPPQSFQTRISDFRTASFHVHLGVHVSTLTCVAVRPCELISPHYSPMSCSQKKGPPSDLHWLKSCCSGNCPPEAPFLR